MRLLAISDIHAHPHKRFSKVEDGRNTRLQDSIRCLAFVRELSSRTGISDVVVAGDLFDAKQRIPVKAVNAVHEELCLWVDFGLNVLMIPGNHDHLQRDGEEHALELFEALEGFQVVHEPSKFVWEQSNGERVGVCAVPYRDDLQREWFEPDREGAVSSRLCVAHAVVAGSQLSDTVTAADDEDALDHEGIPLRQTLPQSWLAPFDLSIVGHVHIPHRLGEHGNILVPGQPYHQHPHESEQRRGVWEIARGDYLMHPVPGVPLFVAATVEESGAVVVGVSVSNNIVMLKPASHNVPGAVVQEAAAGLLQKGARYVDIQPVDSSEDSGDDSGTRLQLSPRMQPAQVADTVLRSGLIDLRGQNVDDLSTLAAEILQDVSQPDD